MNDINQKITRFSWTDKPIFCFTSDVDWASEEILDYSYNLLSGDDLKITFFNTHPSKFINSLSKKGLINQLIHPNFLPGSSHGNTYNEVMEYCAKLVPNADGFRTHRYFEVNDIMDEFVLRGFKYFSNHCLRCEPNINPFHHRSGMVSFPIFFEDGGFLIMSPSLDSNLLQKRMDTPGLKIINFHPAHIAFNTPNFKFTRYIKDSMDRESWNQIDSKKLKSLEYKNFGIRNILFYLIDFILKQNFKIMTLKEIYDEFIEKSDH